ncbi:MAG: LOG family protein [Bacteroidota bacterium]|nr:LOG family protein [Bacteroidota bacterium]MDP4194375.1 LOG family protein [Bacteroidota bacterium]
MDDHKLTVKAYKNQDFLNSPDGRSIRILAEFLEPKARFDKNNIIDTIVLFGSARLLSKSDAQKLYEQVKLLDPKEVPNYAHKLRHAQVMLEMSRYYEDAVELSRLLTEWSLNLPTEKNRFIVCSGGGPGIMEAANKGANLAGGLSVGLNISIPFEQFINTYVTPELKFEFHYFFMRKFWFVYLAKSLIVFPGGFGTMDEFFEVLTLLQTGKIKKQMKVIVYDEKYWKKVINFDALIEFGTINPEDMELFSFCNTPMQAFNEITEHFEKNYLNKITSKKSITL